jgi:hypothetical protein
MKGVVMTDKIDMERLSRQVAEAEKMAVAVEKQQTINNQIDACESSIQTVRTALGEICDTLSIQPEVPGEAPSVATNTRIDVQISKLVSLRTLIDECMPMIHSIRHELTKLE